jgi:hypothetical protein
MSEGISETGKLQTGKNGRRFFQIMIPACAGTNV